MNEDKKITLTLHLTREEELVLETCLRLVACGLLNGDTFIKEEVSSILYNVAVVGFLDQNLRTLLDERIIRIKEATNLESFVALGSQVKVEVSNAERTKEG